MKLTSILTLLSIVGIASATNPSCVGGGIPTNSSNIYDYVVTGSGPGGGTIATNLARAGYSVLLIEAGDDQSANIATQILALGSTGPTSWRFFVRHSDDIERTKKYNLLVWKLKNGELWVGKTPPEKEAEMMGVFYPRGATLGGSAIVNAAATWLPSESDWDYMSKESGDTIWRYDRSAL
jgi:choline dehydrogenase